MHVSGRLLGRRGARGSRVGVSSSHPYSLTVKCSITEACDFFLTSQVIVDSCSQLRLLNLDFCEKVTGPGLEVAFTGSSLTKLQVGAPGPRTCFLQCNSFTLTL